MNADASIHCGERGSGAAGAVDIPIRTTTFERDDAGRLLRLLNASATTEYAWDNGDRPLRWRRGVGVEVLGELKLLYALGLQLRIGISTGRVVIRNGQPVGAAVHHAARLQQAAPAGAVYPAVRGLVVATGFSGHGMQQAPAVGHALASLIAGDPAPLIEALAPDRIALFGYAHVPWMKKHQTMIKDEVLPGLEARFAQMNLAASMLIAAGYEPIGIDHFALPDDRMAIAAREGRLRRNFQGYTDDQAATIIGLGASSVGSFRQGYVQNMPATGQYEKMVLGGDLAVVRGVALSSDDCMRRWVIEQIMCTFGFAFDDLRQFGPAAATVIAEAQALCAVDDMVVIRDNRLEILAPAQPFARSIAATFDAYLAGGAGRHSMAV